VGHGGVGSRAVPVPAARFAPDDVAGTDLGLGLAFALVPADARGDDQGLAQRVGVPGASRAGLKADQRAGRASRIAPGELPLDGDVAGEIVVRALLRRLRAAADDLHWCSLPSRQRLRRELVAGEIPRRGVDRRRTAAMEPA
jgi:hypothetical protein